MSLTSLMIFSGAMLVLAMTPGPGVFTIIATGLASGFKQSAAVAYGIIIGDIIFLLFAIYGLAIVVEKIPWLFSVIQYAGALYLIYLSYKLWTSKPEKLETTGEVESSYKANFLIGLYITLGNPKVILFYLSFLPTLIHLETLSTFDLFAITMVVIVVLAVVLLTYGYTASQIKNLFQTRSSLLRLNHFAGTVMMMTGIAIAIRA